jgi:hypothetical protein
MAKNFPYFKFIATEWLTGDIVYEDFESQGLFINICALYWQRDGKLSIEDITRRYKNESIIQSLSGRFFSVNDGLISINFLDEQLEDANHISKVNSENGKKGAEKRKMLATAKQSLSEPLANFSKEKKNKRKEEEELNIEKSLSLELAFNTFWDLYDKKTDAKNCKAKFLKLNDTERAMIFKVVKNYVDSTPDKKFRKNPSTWLNGKCWEDDFNNLEHTVEKDKPLKISHDELVKQGFFKITL